MSKLLQTVATRQCISVLSIRLIIIILDVCTCDYYETVIWSILLYKCVKKLVVQILTPAPTYIYLFESSERIAYMLKPLH